MREAIINMVMSRTDLAAATVVDLFAGTGALGIEALSQGAARATFVERDPTAAAAIRTNLTALGFAGGEVVRADAVTWVAGAAPVDVAFVDPPYAFDGWAALLESLRTGLAVLESDHELELGARWRVLKVRRHGTTVVTLAAPVAATEQTEKGGR